MPTIYMKVTDDKYELPLAVADTGIELAEMLGISKRAVYQMLYQAKQRGYDSVYKRVEVDDYDGGD